VLEDGSQVAVWLFISRLCFVAMTSDLVYLRGIWCVRDVLALRKLLRIASYIISAT
jgi:hypothetical protein